MMIGTLEKQSDRFFNVRISRLLLEGTIWYNVRVLEMCMLDEIRARRDEIYAIARKHKAEKLWVFGSCARKEERPDSDVDILVRFGSDFGFGSQVGLGDDLNSYFGRKVDVVSERGLSPYIGKFIRKEAVPV
jgi:hypothetical protein